MRISTTFLFLSIVMLNGCDEGWLEVKRDRALIVPETLNDMRLLLRDEVSLTKDNNTLLQLSSDEYYIPVENFNASNSEIIKNSYTWASDIYEGSTNVADWDQAYAQILVANVVLDQLDRVDRNGSNGADWDNIKGSALYLRAKAFFFLAQTFAPHYNPATASTELGIPLRTDPDTNLPTVRASVQETYDRIVADLEAAAPLLYPDPEFIMDASRFAAHGLLARCYLVMGDYEQALDHADVVLQNRPALIDFNELDPSDRYPISRYNEEVIQHSETSLTYGVFTTSSSRVPADFFSLYDENDLRRTIFFTDMGSGEFGTHAFRGSYTGSVQLFSGISTNEMYLIRSECNARLGNTAGAMADLNTLLRRRWATGTFVEFSASDSSEALRLILLERRKELLRRGLRWTDLRRLNAEPAHAITLSRTIDGVQYTLPVNDPRYVMPIPDYIVELSGIQQNRRN